MAALLALPATAVAQRASTANAATFEVRGDLIASRSTTFHGGVAVLWPVSPYLRVGVLAGGGATVDSSAGDGERQSRASGRGEMVARFTPDPRTTARWRPYGQLSLGVLGVRGAGRGRALVAAGIGLEHAPLGSLGVRPAVEVGVGGGLRVALALRAPLR